MKIALCILFDLFSHTCIYYDDSYFSINFLSVFWRFKSTLICLYWEMKMIKTQISCKFHFWVNAKYSLRECFVAACIPKSFKEHLQSKALHKKWIFPLRISPVNATKSAGSYGFGHIYCKNPKWKVSFFKIISFFLNFSMKLVLK